MEADFDMSTLTAGDTDNQVFRIAILPAEAAQSTTLNSAESNGKKLGFISQEIGREINTIGLKSNYAQMQKLVVQMKDELKKIKEQMLNAL